MPLQHKGWCTDKMCQSEYQMCYVNTVLEPIPVLQSVMLSHVIWAPFSAYIYRVH